MTTDITEKGPEKLIVRSMTGNDGLAVAAEGVAETSPPCRGTGYINGRPQDYDRAHAFDVPQLFAILRATQPDAFTKPGLGNTADPKDINRLKFLTRLTRRSRMPERTRRILRDWLTTRPSAK